MDIVLEKFQSNSDLIETSMLYAFSQNYASFSYFKHNTFYMFLSEEGKRAMKALFLKYHQIYNGNSDPICFAVYLQNSKYSKEFKLIYDEVSNLFECYYRNSVNSAKYDKNLFYFIRGYYRKDDIANKYSFMRGSLLDAYVENSYTLQEIIATYEFSEILNRLLFTENLSFEKINKIIFSEISDKELARAIESCLIVVMMHVIFSTDDKDGYLNWKFVINQVKNRPSTYWQIQVNRAICAL